MVNKIKPSQITTPPKIQIAAGSNLADVLKPEHYELMNPYSFQSDGQLGAVPADTPAVTPPEDPTNLDVPDNPDVLELDAPDLADIISATASKYTDLNGVDKVKVVFVVRNHVGASVVGVKGSGG
jgi:hypothetical protein